MSELADRIEAMVVSVTSPDNNIRAVLRNRDNVTVEFRPGSYKKYTEGEIEHQLARLATLLYTGRTRGYRAIMDEFEVTLKNAPSEASDPAERDYLTARNKLQVIASTPRKTIRIKTTGLSNWECRVAKGTLKKLGETEFCQEARTVVATFFRRYNHKVALLKDKYLGLDIPENVRAAVGASPTE